MSLPSATLSIQDGSLGISPTATGKVGVVLGVTSKGTPDTVYGAYRDVSTMVSALGYGPAVEAASLQLLRGGTVYVVPVTPSYDGAASAVTKVGTGAGTVTVNYAPIEQIVVTCTTTGDLGTAAFTFKLGTGPTSAPVTSAAGWSTSYTPVGAPLTKLTFIKGAGAVYYEAGDVFTVTTVIAEASNVAVVRTGASTGHIQQATEPVDDYTIQIEIRSTGAAGTGTFRYTLDNFTDEAGNSICTWSSDILIPSGLRYQFPNTGVVAVFSGGSFTDGDTHSFTTIASGISTTNVNTAMAALYAQTALSYGFVHVAHMPSSAANAGLMAAQVDSDMTEAETAFRYIYGIIDAPTTGTRVLSGGVPIADTADTDSVVASAFVNYAYKRVVHGAGDFLCLSPVNARLCRRPASWQAAAESAARPIHENLHRVRTGPLKAVVRLYRDESATEALDIARFLTLRRHIGRTGVYITRGRTSADSTSDYSRLANRRVMDRACEVTRSKVVDLIGETVAVNDDGTIKEKAAAAIQAEINNALKVALVDEGHASSSTVTVNRAWNVLSSGKVKIAVRVTPLGSADEIEVEIGFTNPNAVAA